MTNEKILTNAGSKSHLIKFESLMFEDCSKLFLDVSDGNDTSTHSYFDLDSEKSCAFFVRTRSAKYMSERNGTIGMPL